MVPPRIIRGSKPKYYVLEPNKTVREVGIAAWSDWFVRHDRVLWKDGDVVTVFQGLATAIFETYGATEEPIKAFTYEEARGNHDTYRNAVSDSSSSG
jgi:hypothetical protein